MSLSSKIHPEGHMKVQNANYQFSKSNFVPRKKGKFFANSCSNTDYLVNYLVINIKNTPNFVQKPTALKIHLKK